MLSLKTKFINGQVQSNANDLSLLFYIVIIFNLFRFSIFPTVV